MMKSIRVALIGDYRADAVAHQAIPPAVQLAAKTLPLTLAPTGLPLPSSTSTTSMITRRFGWYLAVLISMTRACLPLFAGRGKAVSHF